MSITVLINNMVLDGITYYLLPYQGSCFRKGRAAMVWVPREWREGDHNFSLSTLFQNMLVIGERFQGKLGDPWGQSKVAFNKISHDC